MEGSSSYTGVAEGRLFFVVVVVIFVKATVTLSLFSYFVPVIFLYFQQSTDSPLYLINF